MRKLASIRRVADISPIDGADNIELLKIDGWNVVANKGIHKENDLVVFFEIDSFLPVRPEFEFLRKSCFRSTKNLGDGFRLKTVKLRGTISQGLVLKVEDCLNVIEKDGKKYINILDNQTVRSSKNENLQNSKQK